MLACVIRIFIIDIRRVSNGARWQVDCALLGRNVGYLGWKQSFLFQDRPYFLVRPTCRAL